MEVVVFCFVLWLATQKALEYTKAGAAKSRKAYMKRAAKKFPHMSKRQRAGHALRHDTGHALSQLLHGFPAGRHGFAAGWHEGRQAHAQARAGRERAKAEHLETRAALLPEIREYLRRQREAQQQIRRQDAGEGSEGSPEGTTPDDPAGHGYCAYCGTRDDEPCPPECATWTLSGKPYPGREDDPTYSYGPESATSGWPSATAEHAHEAARRASEDGGTWVVTEYPPGGGPGATVATYRNGEEVSPASEGSSGLGAHQENQSTTEGNTMGEVTYASVKARMRQTVTDAEQRQAEAQQAVEATEEHLTWTVAAKGEASTMADEMQSLEVDAATLGAMAEHLEALDAAERQAYELRDQATLNKKAWDQVLESAQQVSNQLEASGHGQLDEAHANAAGGGGKKEFYGEG